MEWSKVLVKIHKEKDRKWKQNRKRKGKKGSRFVSNIEILKRTLIAIERKANKTERDDRVIAGLRYEIEYRERLRYYKLHRDTAVMM